MQKNTPACPDMTASSSASNSRPLHIAQEKLVFPHKASIQIPMWGQTSTFAYCTWIHFQPPKEAAHARLGHTRESRARHTSTLSHVANQLGVFPRRQSPALKHPPAHSRCPLGRILEANNKTSKALPLHTGTQEVPPAHRCAPCEPVHEQGTKGRKHVPEGAHSVHRCP
eukprot:1144471-Pelagomonas_calceolata.AAC.5